MTTFAVNNQTRPGTHYFCFGIPRDPAEAMSPVRRQEMCYFDYADLDSSIVQFHVPPGGRVLEVRIEIQEAWTGASNMVVGDGDNTNGWTEQAAITVGTIGLYSDIDSTYQGAGGKLYQNGDTIDVSVDGTPTAGKALIIIDRLSYEEAVATEE